MSLVSRSLFVAAALVAVTACGSSESASSTPTADTAPADTASTTAAPTTPASPEPDDSPESADDEATSAESTPRTTVPSTTTPSPTVVEDVPSTSTTVAASTTTISIEQTGIAKLLLDADDIGTVWRLTDTGAYEAVPQDPEFVASCPAAQSVDDADAIFEFETEWELIDATAEYDAEFGQIIGRAPDAATASAIVQQFAGMPECNLGAELDEEIIATGGPVEIGGASAATELRIVDDEGTAELLLIAVDDILTVVFIGGNGDDVVGTTLDVAAQAVAKINAS